MKKPKVAILTYHRHDNYGAVLQCYALQQTLLRVGADAYVLDYFCKRDLCPYTLDAIRHRGILPCMISIAGIMTRLPRRKKFKEFRAMLRLTEKYTKGNIADADEKFDKFIVGSDNVWNPDITGFDTTYFLDFVPDPRKCYSYAASMGKGRVPEHREEQFASLLCKFQTITVREEKAAQSLSALLGRKVDFVLDPTLLLPTEEWDKIAVLPNLDKPYILVYQMLPDRALVDYAKEQAQRLRCELAFVPFPQGGVAFGSQSMYGIGPCEWLGLFKKASYVITDSFHGSVFSIIYQKKMVMWISQLSERILNLVDLLGLQGRVAMDGVRPVLEKEISYDQVNQRLFAFRKASLAVLEEIAYAGPDDYA